MREVKKKNASAKSKYSYTCKLDICVDLEINFSHLATVAVAKAADV